MPTSWELSVQHHKFWGEILLLGLLGGRENEASSPCGVCAFRGRAGCGSLTGPSSRTICCTGDRGTSGRPGPRSGCTSGVCPCSIYRQTPSRTGRT